MPSFRGRRQPCFPEDGPEFFKVFLPFTCSHEIVLSLSLHRCIKLTVSSIWWIWDFVFSHSRFRCLFWIKRIKLPFSFALIDSLNYLLVYCFTRFLNPDALFCYKRNLVKQKGIVLGVRDLRISHMSKIRKGPTWPCLLVSWVSPTILIFLKVPNFAFSFVTFYEGI